MTQYAKYKQQSVTSLTAGEQLVLLFDQACVNIAKAINCIENNDIQNAHNAIVKTEDIFYYLMDRLDMNFEISSELLPLYNFVVENLIKANLKKDVEILKEIRPLVCSLRDTWRKAEQLSRTGGQT